MLKKSYLKILLGTIVIALLWGLFWFKTEVEHIEAIRQHRNTIKAQLHAQVQSQYGDIIATELDSHCGRVIYSFKVSDDRSLQQLHFDVDTGQTLDSQWMNNCLLKSE